MQDLSLLYNQVVWISAQGAQIYLHVRLLLDAPQGRSRPEKRVNVTTMAQSQFQTESISEPARGRSEKPESPA